jgi:DNA-directed RNA polymerase subunit M/transcription elongation factor TFIIS
MQSCPECRSQLFERTHRGWSCSACGYLEPLEDAEVLQSLPERGSAHGNVWGEKDNPSRNRDSYLTSRQPAKGSLKVALALARENKRAALAYLQEHVFRDEQILNRDFCSLAFTRIWAIRIRPVAAWGPAWRICTAPRTQQPFCGCWGASRQPKETSSPILRAPENCAEGGALLEWRPKEPP